MFKELEAITGLLGTDRHRVYASFAAIDNYCTVGGTEFNRDQVYFLDTDKHSVHISLTGADRFRSHTFLTGTVPSFPGLKGS